MNKIYYRLCNVFYKWHVYFHNKSVECASKDVKENFKTKVEHRPVNRLNLDEVFDSDCCSDADVVIQVKGRK